MARRPRGRQQRGRRYVCLTGGADEFHLDTVASVEFDYGTEVAGTKTMLGQVSVQNDRVKQCEPHGHLGRTVTSLTSAPNLAQRRAQAPETANEQPLSHRAG